MLKLTRQEQMVLSVVLFLLLVGWAVKAWRLAHPGLAPTKRAVAEEHATN